MKYDIQVVRDDLSCSYTIDSKNLSMLVLSYLKKNCWDSFIGQPIHNANELEYHIKYESMLMLRHLEESGMIRLNRYDYYDFYKPVSDFTTKDYYLHFVQTKYLKGEYSI